MRLSPRFALGAARRANEPFRPPQLLHVLGAGSIIREPASELHPRAWVIWPRDHGFFRRLLAISVSHPYILDQEELTVYPPSQDGLAEACNLGREEVHDVLRDNPDGTADGR